MRVSKRNSAEGPRTGEHIQRSARPLHGNPFVTENNSRDARGLWSNGVNPAMIFLVGSYETRWEK